jgi:hypothetical protein
MDNGCIEDMVVTSWKYKRLHIVTCGRDFNLGIAMLRNYYGTAAGWKGLEVHHFYRQVTRPNRIEGLGGMNLETQL